MEIQAAILLVIVFFLMLAFSVPVSYSIIVSALVTIVAFLTPGFGVFVSAQKMVSGIDSFSLIAVPFFILAGLLMNSGGIAKRLINLALLVLGKVPGSLALTNIAGNAMFGSISGSGIAAATAIGGVMLPLEKEQKYDEGFAAAVNIATAPVGQLIPPTTAFIVFSAAGGGASVAALFMAGWIPGLLWAACCMVVAFFYARKQGYVIKRDKLTAKIVGKTIWDAIPSLFLVVIIIGGILSGKASSVLSFVMSFTGLPAAISKLVLGISSNKYVILLILNIFLLIVGTFMDMAPALLIFTPIFLPIVQSFGMSPIHFGVMMVMNLSVGTITPPVGNVLFVGCSVAKLRVEQVMKHLIPLFVAIFAALMMVTYIPALSEWLPTVLGLLE